MKNAVLLTLVLFVSFRTFADGPTVSGGAYLARAAGCADCHATDLGRPLSGGAVLDTPFGGFYPPNISPDLETGIGRWTEAQFIRSLREGRSPSGSIYYPVFPYRAYTKMSDDDMRSLFLYLRSTAPERRPSREHEIAFPFNQRWLVWFWQELFMRRSSDPFEAIRVSPGPFLPVATRTDQWNRGAYLVEAVMHCTECHTPRTALGAPILSEWMAGSDLKFGNRTPPNITPDSTHGTGLWTQLDWMRFLSSGFVPGGRAVSGEMANVVRNASALSRSDREAVVTYLRSLESVARRGER